MTNPRIMKVGTYSRKLYINESSPLQEFVIDDVGDDFQYYYDKPLYVLVRSTHFRNIEFVKMINRFGFEGGFDKILERISNTEKWCPIELLS